MRKHTESRLDDDKNDEAEDLTRPDPFAAAAENADLRAFLDCLGKLDSKHQTCILEAYYYGYTHDEIAERNATPVGTVKSWIRRGLARIKECLDHD